MLSWLWTSTEMAVASPSVSVISRATVLIVEEGEFGSGGKGWHMLASDVVLADTTTVKMSEQMHQR